MIYVGCLLFFKRGGGGGGGRELFHWDLTVQNSKCDFQPGSMFYRDLFLQVPLCLMTNYATRPLYLPPPPPPPPPQKKKKNPRGSLDIEKTNLFKTW